MESLAQEFGHATFVPFPVIVARLLLAALLGAVIGFEREWRNRSAGLRTHILICVATATFSILTIEIVHLPVFATDSVKGNFNVDPIRIVEAVTAGIAFLSAGTILFSRGKVRGLTTGAGMWLAGAIGLASGIGLWQVALLATVMVVIVLLVLRIFQAKLDMKDEIGEADEGEQDDPNVSAPPAARGNAPRA